MNKQSLLFEREELGRANKYSKKIDTPIYEPKHEKPHLMLLCDDSKTRALIVEIDASNLPENEKAFLRMAAQRHTVFHYERVADYYAHSGPEMQYLMERSALVIIDFNRAIEDGFVSLCEDIRNQYLEEYSSNE